MSQGRVFDVLSNFLGNRRDYSSGVRDNTVSVKVRINGSIENTASDKPGSIGAFDQALRRALKKYYPNEMKILKLVYYFPIIVNVESKGAMALVKTVVGMKFNGETLLFESEPDPDFYTSGCMAVIIGYQECLKKILKKKEVING